MRIIFFLLRKILSQIANGRIKAFSAVCGFGFVAESGIWYNVSRKQSLEVLERKMKRLFVFSSVLAFCAFCFAGNVCKWLGGSGKFSDGNWSVRPVSGNGDTIVIDTTDGNPITLENDLEENFGLSEIKFVSSKCLPLETSGIVEPGKVTLTGKSLYFSVKTGSNAVWIHGSSDEYERGPKVETQMDLRFKSGTVQVTATMVFNGNIAIDDNGALYFDWPSRAMNTASYPTDVTINGDIAGSGGALTSWLGDGGRGHNLILNGKVALKELNTSKNANMKTATELRCRESSIDIFTVKYGYLRFYTKESVSEHTQIHHTYDQFGPGAIGFAGDITYVFDVLKSTGTREGSAKTPVENTYIASGIASTIHMKARESAMFDGYFTKGISIIYDPVGDYTYTLASESDSTTAGSLDVRGGVFKFSGATRFTAANSVTVRSGAKLDLLESTVSNPLSPSTAVTVHKGGKIAIPAGMTLTFKRIFYNGVLLPSGTYSNVEWIEGAGSVVSETDASKEFTSWNNEKGGNWSDSANWTPAKVPASTTDEAYIANDATFDVIADADEYEFKNLFIGPESAGNKNRLLVSKDVFFKNGSAITVRDGGVFEQTAGYASISNLDNVVTLESGAVWRVSGGTNVITSGENNPHGAIAAAEGSLVDVTGGMLKLEALKYYYSSLFLQGGKISVSGSGVFDIVNRANSHNNGVLNHGSGELEFKDDSSFLTAAIGLPPEGKKISYVFRDNAKLEVTHNCLAGFITKTETFFDFGSSNKESFITGRVSLGANNSSKTTTFVREKAIAPKMSSQVVVGGYFKAAGSGLGSTYPKCPTGIVTVAGICDISRIYGSGKDKISGLTIGGTSCEEELASAMPWTRENFWPYGEMNIEPTGFVTNSTYLVAVGVGLGEGCLNIRGGEFIKTDGTFIVGAGNGVGNVRLTENGKLTLFSPLFIGGFIPGELDYSATEKYEWSADYPHESLDSTGKVHVASGAIDLNGGKMTVGLRGNAFIEVGTNGLVKAGDIDLLNSATTSIKFTVGESGSGKIVSLGKIVVADGVKLEIEAVSMPASSTVLFDAAEWDGYFDENDIELEIPAGKTAQVIKSGNRVKFVPSDYLTVIIR
jgi:hypothetical protein